MALQFDAEVKPMFPSKCWAVLVRADVAVWVGRANTVVFFRRLGVIIHAKLLFEVPHPWLTFLYSVGLYSHTELFLFSGPSLGLSDFGFPELDGVHIAGLHVWVRWPVAHLQCWRASTYLESTQDWPMHPPPSGGLICTPACLCSGSHI